MGADSKGLSGTTIHHSKPARTRTSAVSVAPSLRMVRCAPSVGGEGLATVTLRSCLARRRGEPAKDSAL